MKQSIIRMRGDFDRVNLAAARLILDNIERHGGPDAFPVIWARLFMAQRGAAALPETRYSGAAVRWSWPNDR